MPPPSTPFSLPPAIILPAIAAFWCFMCALISRFAPWHRLTQAYRAAGRPSGQRYRMQTGSVGGMSYRQCLTIHVSPKGIGLSVLFLFRPGHPPLFIPWSDIHNMVPECYWWHQTVTFTVGSPTITRIRLPKAVFEDAGIAI